MGSDNMKSRRGGGRKLPVGRLLVLFVALVFLFWNTTEPGGKTVKAHRKLIAERQEKRVVETVPYKAPPTEVAEEAADAERVQAEPDDEVEKQHEHKAVADKPLITTARGLYRFSAVDIDGDKQPLRQFAGQVSLVVNVASNCGYTAANYKGLTSLYDDLKGDGLTVLAFPCNEFGEQEPGTEAEIKAFAAEQGAAFPLFSKVYVNGANAHPVYEWLKLQPGFEGDLAWNFVKFLVSRNGKVLKRYDSSWDDAKIRADVADALREAIDTSR